MKGSEAAVSETYLEMEKLVYHTVYKFVKRYGGDAEEYIAEANVVFLKVYKAFDPARGFRMSTLLVKSIWNRLIDLRNDAHAEARIGIKSLDAEGEDGRSMAGSVAEYNPPEWEMPSLSADAREVVKLILDSPAELLDLVRVSGSINEVMGGKGLLKRSWRDAVKLYLKDMGWPAYRVAKSFVEIKEALAA